MVFHSDLGSQYTSQYFRKLLEAYGLRASMGNVSSCHDNAAIERFFGSLKHDWILKVHQPTRSFIKPDVAAYMKYYYLERLHTSNGDMSAINDENSLINVPSFAWPVQTSMYLQLCFCRVVSNITADFFGKNTCR